jgi:hypothetical protein
MGWPNCMLNPPFASLFTPLHWSNHHKMILFVLFIAGMKCFLGVKNFGISLRHAARALGKMQASGGSPPWDAIPENPAVHFSETFGNGILNGHLWEMGPARFWALGTGIRRENTRAGEPHPGARNRVLHRFLPPLSPLTEASMDNPTPCSDLNRNTHRMPGGWERGARRGRGGAGGSRGDVV